MAKLIVKLLSGEAFDIKDLALEHVSPESLIREMIFCGALPPEDSFPIRSDGSHATYSIIDKNNVKVPVHLGDLHEYDDVNFDKVSPKEIIDNLIQTEILKPESELPRKKCDGRSGYYGVLDKDNNKINTLDIPCNKPLSEYGFEDGDTLRITVVACCA